MIQNSIKMTVVKYNKNNPMVGVSTPRGALGWQRSTVVHAYSDHGLICGSGHVNMIVVARWPKQGQTLSHQCDPHRAVAGPPG